MNKKHFFLLLLLIFHFASFSSEKKDSVLIRTFLKNNCTFDTINNSRVDTLCKNFFNLKKFEINGLEFLSNNYGCILTSEIEFAKEIRFFCYRDIICFFFIGNETKGHNVVFIFEKGKLAYQIKFKKFEHEFQTNVDCVDKIEIVSDSLIRMKYYPSGVDDIIVRNNRNIESYYDNELLRTIMDGSAEVANFKIGERNLGKNNFSTFIIISPNNL